MRKRMQKIAASLQKKEEAIIDPMFATPKRTFATPRTPPNPRVNPYFLGDVAKDPRGIPQYQHQKYPRDTEDNVAVYGEHAGLGIHGPVDYDTYYTDWGQVGQQYKMPATNRPLPSVHDATLNKYGIIFQRSIGRGGFGEVYETQVNKLVKDKQKRYIQLTLACKILSLVQFSAGTPLKTAMEELLAESFLHSILDHPNIVRVAEIFYVYDEVSSFPKPIHVLHFMELCQGDLKSLIDRTQEKKFSESKSREWFVQVVDALKYLHDSNVVHMDLKLGNILYKTNPGNPNQIIYKLADFGIAERFKEHMPAISNRPRGTPDYMAPEVKNYSFMRQPFDAKRADIYSLAVCLAESMAGLTVPGIPFHEYPFKLLLAEVNHWTDNTFRTWGIGKGSADLLASMTKQTPSARFSCNHVLNHPFVAEMRYQSGGRSNA